MEGRPGLLEGQLERAAGHLDDVAREREVVAQESLVAHNAVGPDDSRLAGDTLLQCHAQRGDAGFRKPDAVHRLQRLEEDLIHLPIHRDQLMLDAVEFLNRSEEHTSELQSILRISYAVFCLKKKKQ